MDIAAVRTALKNVVKTALPELTCYPTVPYAVEPPCFYVTGPAITYDVTFGGDDDMDQWVCRILTSKADEDGQTLLDSYLSRGSKSVKLAIEGTPGVPQTLGGTCDDVHVRRASPARLFEHAGETYYGAELFVHVIG